MPAKSPQKRQIVAKKENAAPAVEQRTAEEIDASYRKNLARFEEAKAKFETALANKMNEIAAVYGEGEPLFDSPESWRHKGFRIYV